jgi:hypothetical protein
MYSAGRGFEIIGQLRDHDGFDGVMLGLAGASYHLEFTRHRGGGITPSPTPEEWTRTCRKPRGRTFEDPGGYRTVLERASWGATP